MSAAEPVIEQLPRTSRLELDDDSSERFACHFSHNWRDTWSLAAFAVCWNAFTIFVVVMRLTGGFVNAQGPLNWDEMVTFAFLTLSGLALTGFWAWSRYRQIDVLFTAESAAVTRTFWGHPTTATTSFDRETTADLCRFWSEAGTISQIEIDGADGRLEFGRELDEAENRFLLHQIQRIANLPDSETLRRRLTDAIDEAPRLPDGSRLQLLEDSQRRLEIVLPPPGRHERSLRYLALFGNAIMFVLSLWVIPQFLKGAPDFTAQAIFFTVFCGIWLVFVVLAIAWLIQRFAEYVVHVQPGHFFLKRTIFGRETAKETRIDATCTAELVIWAGKNDEAAYAVQVTGLDRAIRFGEMQSERDKRYLVRMLRFVFREKR